MPRRQFIADFQRAQSTPPPGILALEQGEDDGSFTFSYIVDEEAVSVTALVPELSDYPQSHEYMIYCASDDAPQAVAAALQDIRGTDRKTVFELLDIVAARLSRLRPDRDGDVDMPDSQLDDEYEEYGGDDDVYGSDDDFQIGPAAPRTPAVAVANQTSATFSTSTRALRIRIRTDLRAAKSAGFKVGHLGHLLEGANCYVTLSVRILKLGISEEAMQAWQLEPNDYLTLIIQYPNGYKTNEELQGFDSLRLRANLAMRVVAGKKYKPTLQESIKAFTKIKKGDRVSDLPPSQSVEQSSIRETFISKSLAALLEERLVPILRYRSAGMDWQGAEQWDLEVTSAATRSPLNANAPSHGYFKPEQTSSMLPAIVTGDHYQDPNVSWSYSFPLLAAQFTLRHFVRCTEFCLVCHRKLEGELEAIKPYVCDSPLCLFQYMAMGFGPSIEHEIIAQPYVVDLLVSFCYNAAATFRLKDFPIGLALSVPPPSSLPQGANVAVPPVRYTPGFYNQPQPTEEEKASQVDSQLHHVGFDRDRLELIFHQPPPRCPVRRGDWIVINCPGLLSASDDELHCRVSESIFFPTISIDPPVRSDSSLSPNYGTNTISGAMEKMEQQSDMPKPVTPAATPKWTPATFYIYDQDFELLSNGDKCSAITRLLSTLPTVKEMQDYLVRHHAADLKGWVERISPAALSILRWIIASNRACIMQNEVHNSGMAQGKQERLCGMKDYMQFRFAMGAPDKEQRFITSVRETTERLKLQHPTIFAWHGSPLYNWHSIIREGLHFKQIAHGRAYGDGVYHALEAQTSTGYAGRHHSGSYATGRASPGTWPRSVLRISSAIALNEIVNAPAEFQSQHPFYVVKQLDWIQTRFLFVQVDPADESIKIGEEVKPETVYKQDPSRIPKGMKGDAVVIPASAIKSTKTVQDPAKQEKRKSKSLSEKVTAVAKKFRDNGGKAQPILLEDADDGLSDCTDQEDTDLLEDEPEMPSPPPGNVTDSASKAGRKVVAGPKTDFKPGMLEFDKLPLMPTPQYANTSTTKRIMSELVSLSKVQDSTPPAELGWYIDVEKIENVYQWIVELHSFHTLSDARGQPLALVDEMKSAGLPSIVLEVRFGADFPFTPPYVRVIKPRFLGFNQGGGGHIVLGGAMCMELLTNSGWSSVTSMESVLMQVRMAIASDPPARLDKNSTRKGACMQYGAGEAAEGYIRACAAHGWKVPPGFREMAYGSSSNSH